MWTFKSAAVRPIGLGVLRLDASPGRRLGLDPSSWMYRMRLTRLRYVSCIYYFPAIFIYLYYSNNFKEDLKERDTFLERLYELHPIARGLSPEGHCDFLMGDVLPRETENTVYGYLTAISKLRLGILIEQGEGS